ncbi:MAG: CPBP family intramembrane metalloprotease [Eubacteriales bacterium]|nr:CPBP family intramembrane metalloprotease [Eubacteriales bacterium]
MKDKSTFLPGLTLFYCFIILTVCSIGFDFVFSRFPSIGIMVVELLAFVPPAYCMYHAQDDSFQINFRCKRRASERFAIQFGFTVKFALAVSFLSFLANMIIYVICGATDIDISSMITTSGIGNRYGWLSFLGIAIVSPIAEEIFVRGALFSAFEREAGTALSIVLSAVCFAMLHGSLFNFAGPLIAGCAYAFLVYMFDSIWPAILAHVINNCYYYVINYLVNLYSSFGIWKYFTYINVILFLLFLYLTLRSLESLIQQHQLRPLRPNHGSGLLAVRDCVVNPGFFIFISSFVVSIALK